MDDHISDEEFKLIMEELNEYKAMKEEEASLTERGRQEARESFRRLVEKNDKTGI